MVFLAGKRVLTFFESQRGPAGSRSANNQSNADAVQS